MSAGERPGGHAGAQDLTVGPIGPALFRFALPVLAGNILLSLNGSINAIWIGRLLGDVALTATGNATQVYFLLLAAVFGLGLAATILIGQATGRRDMATVKRVVGTTTGFFIAFSVLIAALGYLLARPLLELMATPAPAFPLAVEYLRIIFLAVPVIYLNIFAGMALRGVGDSKTPFRFQLVAILLDVGLAPLLIIGWGPFPELGIAGAAVAALVSQLAALIGTVLFLAARGSPLILRGADLRLLLPDPALIRTIVLKGVPMGLQMVVVSISGLTMMGIANQYGVTTVAGYNVAIQLWAYVQMPAMAMSAASSAFAAQNIGAQLWDRVDQVAWKGTLIATGFILLGIVLVYAFERPLVGLFLPGDAAALAVAERVNLYGLWGWVFFGGLMVTGAVIRSAGAVWPPLLIVAAALLLVRIPAALFAQRWFGADAIWLSSSASLLLGLALSVAYYRLGPWRSARMGPEPAAPPAATRPEPEAAPVA